MIKNPKNLCFYLIFSYCGVCKNRIILGKPGNSDNSDRSDNSDKNNETLTTLTKNLCRFL